MQVLSRPKASKSLARETLPNGYTQEQIAKAISPRIQEYIILPTEKCNFRCTYCYEDFAIGKMSAATQRAVELLIERRVPKLEQLSLSWFGGEPLVAKDVVLRISRFADRLCEQHGVAFHGGLTTNAYLLDQALAKELLECKQNFFQITVDGWEDAHDEVRRLGSGHGTFSRIWTNLQGLRALDSEFEVILRVHLRGQNLDNTKFLLEQFARTFEGDVRFSLDFQHLRDLGGEGGKTITDPIAADLLDQIETDMRTTYQRGYFEHIGAQAVAPRAVEQAVPAVNDAASAPKAQQEKSLLDKTAGESSGSRRASESSVNEPYICYAARPNSMLIRANGRLGKCTVAFSDARNDLGYLAPDGTVHVNNEKLRPWMRGLSSLDHGETGCPLVTLPEEILESPFPARGNGKRVVPIRAIESTLS
jgi:uncharacterized protein